ncbi:MAG: hypothetical protein JO239_00395, partial [Paraburkholderia sp.]|nr:hypothetical protein [Paraburkholderia sp.]
MAQRKKGQVQSSAVDDEVGAHTGAHVGNAPQGNAPQPHISQCGAEAKEWETI